MNPSEPLDRRLDGVAIVLLVLLALAIQLPFFDRWVSLLDEGAISQIADQINRGMPPYENGVHLAFPGIFYLTAALYELFGPSLLVGRWLMVVAFCTLVTLVYVLARSISGRGIAFATGVLTIAYRAWAFPHWHMLSYSPLAILWQFVAVVLLSFYVRSPRTSLLFCAGLATGMGALFKQDSSAIICIVLGVFLLIFFRRNEDVEGSGKPDAARNWSTAIRDTTIYGAAAALPPVSMLLAFAPCGLTLEILYQTVWVPLIAKPLWTTASAGGSYTMFPPLWPPWEASDAIRRDGFFAYLPSLLLDLHWKELITTSYFQKTILPETFVRIFYLAPYLTLAALSGRGLVAWRLRATRRDDSRWALSQQLRLLIAFGVGMMLSFNRPRDWVHLMILYVPTLVLSAGLVEFLAGDKPGIRRQLVGVGHGLIALGALAFSGWLIWSAHGYYNTPIISARAGIYGKEHVAAVLNPLLKKLAIDEPSDPPQLGAFPAYPILNFLTARPLATRFLTLLPLEEFPDRDQQIIESMTRDSRTEFVYSLQRAAVDERPQEYAPGVFQHLVRNWVLGAGPGEVFNGTENDGLIIVRLLPRVRQPERVVYDFAAQLDSGVLSYVDQAGKKSDERSSGVADPGELVAIDAWPFESPVLSLNPPKPPLRTQILYSVSLDEPAQLRFGVAMNPDSWTDFLHFSLRFIVRVDGEVVFDQQHDPRRRFEDRRWMWADLTISSGSHSISFETGTDNGYGAIPTIAGFARPRLAIDLSRSPK